MPDHVHFFSSSVDSTRSLWDFMQRWKQWTSKRIIHEVGLEGPVWQAEFFDDLLRSSESYEQKWNYVRENPVRAGLVAVAGDWSWQGEVEGLHLAPL
jgi:REP element-mobilizing transposase RayT